MLSQNLTPLILVTVAVMTTACSPARYETILGTSVNATSLGSTSGGATSKTVDAFSVGADAGKVDILIINDNSASMGTEQLKLATRFSHFVSGLADLDYQVAMTTTDLQSAQYNLDGLIMTWSEANTKILTSLTPNAATVFANSIQRPETASCATTGVCPSGNEQPLGAMVRAFAHANGANSGFFRSGVPLAIFVLSDEDEDSDGTQGTTANQVLTAFSTTFGTSKKLGVFGTIVQPGDSTCRNLQRAQPNGAGYYGTHVSALVAATGGITSSICDDDYSQGLESISRQFRSLTTSYQLSADPQTNSVEVIFTPAQSIGYTINGKILTLDSPAAAGTTIQVRYYPN